MGRTVAHGSIDRRIGPRRSIDGEACLFDETGEPFTLTIGDVGPTGVFLRSDVVFSHGDELWVSFTVPDGPKLVVRGRVARVDLGLSSPGMGLQFLDVTPREAGWLGNYVGGVPEAGDLMMAPVAPPSRGKPLAISLPGAHSPGQL